jgi:hypothetical protein
VRSRLSSQPTLLEHIVAYATPRCITRMRHVSGAWQLGVERPRRAEERTRTAYPCSSYEFACVHASPFWCVRKLRLFTQFLMIWRPHFVYCVPVRISPVALRVGVNPLEQTRMVFLIPGDNPGVAGVRTGLASPRYLSGFLFSALHGVAPYCVPGGVKVESISPCCPRSMSRFELRATT